MYGVNIVWKEKRDCQKLDIISAMVTLSFQLVVFTGKHNKKTVLQERYPVQELAQVLGSCKKEIGWMT